MSITVISVCDLNLSDNWDISCQQVKDFCASTKAHYYAEPRESFSVNEAIEEARRLGKTSVVVEDLS